MTTYEQAIEAAQAGKNVRRKASGKGWAAHWYKGCLWWVNPATGSEIAFPPNPEDKAATDWQVVP